MTPLAITTMIALYMTALLMKVLAGTNRGDRVLDCFAGSGSTLLACDRLDRRWVGVERDGEYCGIAHRRIDDERRQRRLPLLER